MLKVAQVGLGTIGSIFARHLAAEDIESTVFDQNPDRYVGLPETVRCAGTIRDAVSQAQYVLVSLPDPSAERIAMLSASGIIASVQPGTVILDLSTIDPQTAREAYDTARQRGVHYVEAPVSGGEPMSAGTDGAHNRNVTFMAGSDAQSFEKAKPLMEMIGKFPIHIGPAGSGAIVKLISNYISGLHNVVAAEGFALGRAAGIDPELMLKVFAHTDANSYWLFNYFAPRIRSGNFEPGFSVDLQYKDLRLADELARQLKVPMPLNAAAIQVYQVLRARGDGGKDLVEVANLIAEWAGLADYRQAK